MLRTLVKSKALPPYLSNPGGTDYRSIFIVHGSALLLTLCFGVDELKIVAFYAISVLVGFLLSLTAAVKFAFYTNTRYLYLAILMAYYLHKKWIAGGKLPINFSH